MSKYELLTFEEGELTHKIFSMRKTEKYIISSTVFFLKFNN